MKQKNIKQRIISYFFDHPTAKLRVREIERELGVPLPSVIRYVKELCNEHILQNVMIGRVSLYTSNRSSSHYLLHKRLYNIRKLYDSGLVDYINEECSHPSMVVFGSYAQGDDIEKSDIDLYIESQKVPSVTLFEKKLNRPIQIVSSKNLHSLKNKELANSIVNGFVLNGFLEVL